MSSGGEQSADLIRTLSLGGVELRRALGGNDSCPHEVLEYLASDIDAGVRVAVAGNPNSGRVEIQKLQTDDHPSVRAAVAGNPNSPTSILEQLATDSHVEVRAAVAGNPQSPERVLVSLAADNSSVREALLTNPSCRSDLHQQLFDSLARDEYVGVLVRLAGAPNCPSRFLVVLADRYPPRKRSDHDRIRITSAIAANRNTPTAVLERLAHDDGIVYGKQDGNRVHEMLATNPSTPAHVLETFSQDNSVDLRQSVAGNASTPLLILELLAHDEHWWVRSSLAANPSCSVSALERLCTDDCDAVLEAIACNPIATESLLSSLSEHWAWPVRAAVGRNANCPRPVLETLARDTNASVRSAVASNHNLATTAWNSLVREPSVLEAWVSTGRSAIDWKAAADATDAFTRLRLAINPLTPQDIIEDLSEDPVWFVRWQAIQSLRGNSERLERVLGSFGASEEANLRWVAAASPATPSDTLQTLATDDDEQVRFAVLDNPSATTEIRSIAELVGTHRPEWTEEEQQDYEEDLRASDDLETTKLARLWRSVTEHSTDAIPSRPDSERRKWAVGETGPGGGTVFFDAGVAQWWGRYLEVAPKGWARTSSILGDGESGFDIDDENDPKVVWSDIEFEDQNFNTGMGIGWGLINTWKIIELAGPKSAAWLAASYRGGGYTDWFLPSAVELNEWRAPAEYWSSSQDDWCYLEDGNYTVELGPVSGDQPDNLDEYIHFVRPMRAF